MNEENNKVIDSNKLIADFMGKRYDYIACDNCGKLDPELINPGKSRLTKCCSTYDKDSELCFYTTQDSDGKDIYAIGKTYMPHGTSSKDLRYHTSWDWLMPVVEKIMLTEYDYGMDHAYMKTFGKLSDTNKPLVRFNRCSIYEGKTLLEATYAAVVDFIHYYNQQKLEKE